MTIVKVVINPESGEAHLLQHNEMVKSSDIFEMTEAEYDDHRKKIRKIKKKEEKEKKDSIKKFRILNGFKLPIDNYVENAKRFYELQPYFYDKAGIFWFWDREESKYLIVDDVDVMTAFDNTLGYQGETVNNKIKNNTLEAMKRIGRERIPKPAKKKWVQFKNKAFSIFSGHIHEITPDYFFTNPIPWEIGESDETPTMDKLFTEWVGKDNLPLLYEIIAYCCYTDYPIHRIFCFVGSGSNGKSRFMALIEKFLGDNVCASELDDLINNRFESFKLYRKLCCEMGETNFGILNKTSLLKKLSGQDIISFEKKNKDPFNDHSYAKILISSNSLPISDDNTDGFYRRWTIVDFPNQFQEGKDILEIIPPQEYNNLAKKCVILLKKLLEIGQFTNQGSISDRKKKYIEVSNPITIFIAENCQISPEFYANYSELYTAYVQYLKKIKKRRVKSSEFKKALEDEGYYVEKTSKRINDEFRNGFWVEGLRICDNCDNYAKFSTLSPVCVEDIEKVSQKSQKSQKQLVPSETEVENKREDLIFLKCHICNLSPCIEYDPNAQGKPICEFCLKDRAETSPISPTIPEGEEREGE